MIITKLIPVIALTEKAVRAAGLHSHPANFKEPLPLNVEATSKQLSDVPKLLHLALERLRRGTSETVIETVDEALVELKNYRQTHLGEMQQWLLGFARRFPALFRSEEPENFIPNSWDRLIVSMRDLHFTAKEQKLFSSFIVASRIYGQAQPPHLSTFSEAVRHALTILIAHLGYPHSAPIQRVLTSLLTTFPLFDDQRAHVSPDKGFAVLTARKRQLGVGNRDIATAWVALAAAQKLEEAYNHAIKLISKNDILKTDIRIYVQTEKDLFIVSNKISSLPKWNNTDGSPHRINVSVDLQNDTPILFLRVAKEQSLQTTKKTESSILKNTPAIVQSSHAKDKPADFFRFAIPSKNPWNQFIQSLSERGLAENDIASLKRFIIGNDITQIAPASAELESGHKAYSFVRALLPAIDANPSKSIAHLALRTVLHEVIPQRLARMHFVIHPNVILMASTLPTSGDRETWLFVDSIRELDSAFGILNNEPHPSSHYTALTRVGLTVQVFGDNQDGETVQKKLNAQKWAWVEQGFDLHLLKIKIVLVPRKQNLSTSTPTSLTIAQNRKKIFRPRSIKQLHPLNRGYGLFTPRYLSLFNKGG